MLQEVQQSRAKNLELYQLVAIIDDKSEYSDIRVAKLRKIIDYLKVFDDIDQAEKYLKETSDTTTFLIGTVNLAKMFCPIIHNYRQIQSIYLYHSWPATTKQMEDYHMITAYRKIRSIHSCFEEILSGEIIKDADIYHNRIIGEYNHSIFSALTDETTGDSIYPWWHDFVYALTLIEYDNNSLEELITELKTYYAEDTNEMNRIIEFENTYTSSDAIKWYTRPIFLYRILNQALRQRNIKTVSKFGFYLKDLYKQLALEHRKYIEIITSESVPPKCYRGQIMSQSEIQLLINKLCAFHANSMLSTTSDRHVATLFLQPSNLNDEFQSALFEIRFNSELIKTPTWPFANISNLSFIENEDEILFTAGTRFDLNDFSYDEDLKIWLVDVIYMEDKQELSISNMIGTEKAKLKQCIKTLGFNLSETSYETKRLVFTELIRLCPSFSWISAIELQNQRYVDRSFQKTANEEHMQKIKELESALNIWLTHINDSDLDCSYDIGALYEEIALHYESIGDFQMANKNWDGQLVYYNNMIKRAEQTQDFRQVLTSPNIYLECAVNHQVRKTDGNRQQDKINQNNALLYYEKLLNLTLQYSPEDKTILRTCCFGMAYIHYKNLNYDMTITFYEQYLSFIDTQLNSTTSDFLCDVSNALQMLAGIYYHYKCDYNSALKYQLENYHLFHSCTNDSDSPKAFSILLGLSQIYKALHQDDLVKKNLEKAQKLYPEHSIEELYNMINSTQYIQI